MATKKISGADIEFGNSIVSSETDVSGISSWRACDCLLAEAPGLRTSRSWGQRSSVGSEASSCSSTTRYAYGSDGCGSSAASSSFSTINDYGRRWGNYCVYGDMGHCEGCLPESTSCFDHVALWHGLLNLMGDMRASADEKLGKGQELFVTANNSDGTLSTSWGGHFNLAIDRALFSAIFRRKPHVLSFLASYLAAASVVFGQGHVLRPRNGKARFVLLSRAHHIGVLVALATTIAFRRPLVNLRDESHASGNLARLHLICFDTTLQQVGTLLRVWLTQAFLAALEEGYCDTRLLLDDPVAATHLWSCGFSPASGRIEKRCKLAVGGSISAVELLHGITEGILGMFDKGAISDDVVPDTQRVLPLWKRALKALGEGDLLQLARTFDWALKLMILEREMSQRDLDLGSDEVLLMNQLFSHVDKDIGLYWPFEKTGFVETCVTPQFVAKMQHDGPEDTRAFARKAIIEKFSERICDVNWGELSVRLELGSWFYSRRKRILLADPARFSKAEVGELIDGAESIEDLCSALEDLDSLSSSESQSSHASGSCQSSSGCYPVVQTVPPSALGHHDDEASPEGVS